MKDMFDEYVKSRILQNWKFWIVSLVFFLALSFPRQHTKTVDSALGYPWKKGSHIVISDLELAVLFSVSEKRRLWAGPRGWGDHIQELFREG